MTQNFKDAQNVETKDQKQYHLPARPGDVADLILLVGDPDRCDEVATHFSSIRYQDEHRELCVRSGDYKGVDISVVSTGMGDGSTEICVVELCKIVKTPTFLRCGTCGILDPDIGLGDLIITSGALRLSNTMDYYVPPTYPSIADLDVQQALIQSAKKHKIHYHHGLTATAPGFYSPQSRKIEGFPVEQPDLPEKLGRLGVLNLEMEAATILTLASLRKARAGAICAGIASRPQNQFFDSENIAKAVQKTIVVALDALHSLHQNT
ncbi:MAG: nucleoside phosphorylase [Bdellovibrionales bacterium]|nr:nucleoside phosphorylase [Bdellovibrionales bacterium]